MIVCKINVNIIILNRNLEMVRFVDLDGCISIIKLNYDKLDFCKA